MAWPGSILVIFIGASWKSCCVVFSFVTLNEPAKIPLVIAAFDDFGLKDIILKARVGESEEPKEILLKTYKQAERSDSLLASLDVPEFKPQPGQVIRYRAVVRDRRVRVEPGPAPAEPPPPKNVRKKSLKPAMSSALPRNS